MTETLEEAAFRLYPKFISDPYNPTEDLMEEERNIFIAGAKWQAERMYSEEDLREAFSQGEDNMDYSDTYGWTSKRTVQQWFEQFKKK